IIDGYSRFLNAIPLPDKSMDTVVNALTTRFFPLFGLPERIHSDNGTEFRNQLMERLNHFLGIRHSFSSAYHPQGNGIIERAHRFVGNALRSFAEDDPTRWDELIQVLVMSYNQTVHKSTGFTPYFLFFGRPPINPFAPAEKGDERRDALQFADHAEKFEYDL